jgi:tRNA modification GTPase
MSFSTSDTIVAIATPPGRGGIGVVRISGPEARAVAEALIAHAAPLTPRHATFTMVRLEPMVRREPTVRLKPDATYEIDSARADTPSTAVVSRFSRTVMAQTNAMAQTIDHVVVTYFPGPHSYTGEDVVELSAHGSPVVLRAIVAAAAAAGARLAEPGEFTLRAFLNGRIDLPQAEAVADLVDAATPLQARAAFDQLQGTLTKTIAQIDASLFDLIARLEASVDFPDEGYHFIDRSALVAAIDELREAIDKLLADGQRGRLVREGFHAVIIGKPNVGKSSVFNALAGAPRAIVTDVPGTTRDLVTEVIDLDGLRATLVDTAGLRATSDVVEAEGVARTRQAQTVADVVIAVLDRSRPLDAEDRAIATQAAECKGVIVANKADLPAAWRAGEVVGAIDVSALTGAGLDTLRARIATALDIDLLPERPAITNIRHIGLMQQARDALLRARAAACADREALPEEFVLADLQDARSAFEQVTGSRTSEDVLAHIFSRFCIGK